MYAPDRDLSITATSVSFFVTGVGGLAILYAVVYRALPSPRAVVSALSGRAVTTNLHRTPVRIRAIAPRLLHPALGRSRSLCVGEALMVVRPLQAVALTSLWPVNQVTSPTWSVNLVPQRPDRG